MKKRWEELITIPFDLSEKNEICEKKKFNNYFCQKIVENKRK